MNVSFALWELFFQTLSDSELLISESNLTRQCSFENKLANGNHSQRHCPQKSEPQQLVLPDTKVKFDTKPLYVKYFQKPSQSLGLCCVFKAIQRMRALLSVFQNRSWFHTLRLHLPSISSPYQRQETHEVIKLNFNSERKFFFSTEMANPFRFSLFS